ncbi:hypothetical protein [Marinobacter shengliensis]|jgi:hypothetical protein|uniref:hypothetical protein n=1 Tax=Marinobacter shengliensis TaxID=1389223 RepID=UPI0025741D15|nr:hypothetical protein [Marinobacter shengliensis]BEH14760.1 hypothetical protein MAALD49_21280 [Marinobacter shengliensis]
MLSHVSKTLILTVPLAAMLTACGGSSGGSNANGTNQQNGEGDTPPVTPQMVQLFIGDDCPFENARILINNSNGELVGEAQSDAEGFFDVNEVPETGSFGLVYADMDEDSSYDGAWATHIDRSLIMGNSSVHVMDRWGVCETGPVEPAETFTVTIDNFDDFRLVSYRSEGLARAVSGQEVELEVNTGTVLFLASNRPEDQLPVRSADTEYYTVIETSEYASGDTLTVSLNRSTRELGVYTAPGSNTDVDGFYWISESGSRIELFSVLDLSRPVMVVDEPGRFVARGLLDDGPDSGARGNDFVVVNSEAETGEFLTFADQRDKLQNTLFTDGRFFFEYYGEAAGYTIGTVLAPQLRRFYIADKGASPLKMPELTNDLVIAGGAVEGANLFIDTLDPRKYSIGSFVELRVDGEPATDMVGRPTRTLEDSHVNFNQSGL